MKFLIKSFLLSLTVLTSLNFFCSDFDARYAFSLLEKQSSFGPRVPGSEAHKKTVDFIVDFLNKYVDTVYVQKFSKKVSYSKKEIEFYNIVGVLNKDKEENIMLFSHFDSRPFSNKKGEPTSGANDGASSTALLLYLSKYFKENGFKERIDFVFFDGEDGGSITHPEDWFIGSKYFSENYSGKIPKIAILVDMIGDRELNIKREINSEIVNSKLYDKIFEKAKKLGKKSFINKLGFFVEDDHIPLNKKGFKCVDIIDIEYKYWHTTEDTPDKCSEESLKDVGEVLIETIYDR
uniref:M28 family peptidase n=1 Tax=candidate division WOR-3 bacterium TaxID=2052148 RepID=A0A7C3N8D1_UNCW3